MTIDPPLETLTVAEKVRLLERVWSSLCNRPADVESPEWHRTTLEERSRNLEEDRAAVSPWSEAKARLLQAGS